MFRRLLLAAFLTGCQALRPGPAAGEAEAEPAFPPPDCRGVAGRIVVLDPGHGGREAGAVGPAGTEEKAVNLAVALELSRLLDAAGAQVHLTRQDDREVAGPDGSLGQELQARSDLANRLGADLLLSIHHNATLGEKTTDRSATETYYRMDDLGPSLEAATAIHRWLGRGLNLPSEALIPGNYAVLRRARTAAVLGEASHITNPATEARLKTAAGIAQEAEAYFYGICEYFGPGVPRVLSLAVRYDPDPLRPVVVARVSGGGSPLDPRAVRLEVDGLQERPVLRGDTLAWQAPVPLANGDHPLRIRVRNVGGRSSVAATASIRVNAPPAAITLAPALAGPPSGGPLPVIVSVVDVLGRPVADGTRVRLKSTGGELAQDEIVTRGGQAAAYIIRIPAAGVTLTARQGSIQADLKIPGKSRPALMGLVTGRGGQPLEGAQILITSATRSSASRTNREGLWWIGQQPGGLQEIRIWAPGYREEVLDAHSASFRWTELEPVAGLWVDQVVVIDPEGGDARQRTAGSRAQQANWLVATHLEQTFEAAGARVRLTRRQDESPPDVVRVRIANESDASLYLRIGHPEGAGRRTRAAHYPSSRLGERLAEGIARSLSAALGTANDGPVPSTIYPLIQTTSPAVAVYPSGIEDIPDSSLEARCRLEADAIFRGLVPAQPGAAQLKIRALTGDAPVANALVRLDGAWVGQTGPDGTWTFPDTLPGEHHLTIDDGKRVRSVRIIGLEAGETRQVTVEMDRPELPADLAALPTCIRPDPDEVELEPTITFATR